MPNTEPDTKAGGYLTLLPYLAREQYEVTSIIWAMTPWGAPLVSGLRGAVSASGEPWLGLTYESPVSYLRVAAPLQQKELEFLHLQRLTVDARAAMGTELFDAILEQGEPPDFTVASQGQSVGVEMTQFTIANRRQAQGLFFEVSSRVANQQRHRISHLSGYQIFMWFGSASDPAGLPYRKNDSSLYDQLVEALVAHSPDPEAHKVQGEALPQELGDWPVQSAKDARYFSIPLVGGAPASPFYATTGMHTNLAYQSDHSATEEWAKLRAAIARKDRERNNVLVISAGGPDNLGRCFASEEALAEFLLQHPEPVYAQHLSSIIMHFWSTGQAVQLLGDQPRELWPGYFQGWSSAFHAYNVPEHGA
jgi:hypothetical protein